jgi:hypothetical protein
VRIGGTVHAPKLEPPSPAEVARGLAGGLLRRVLTGPPEKEGAVKERGDG